MKRLFSLGLICLLGGFSFTGEAGPASAPAATTNSAAATPATARGDYVLGANDVLQVKVYQEDDLDAKVRIAKDGNVTLPLIGAVKVGGNTREQAAAIIKGRLGEKYLVNPQVTVDVIEFSKRSYNVMGQVNRPGTYEFPADEKVNLLQAISRAGGYTRLGAGNKITLQRGEGASKKILKLDADSMAKDNAAIFYVEPEDTITVGEKIF